MVGCGVRFGRFPTEVEFQLYDLTVFKVSELERMVCEWFKNSTQHIHDYHTPGAAMMMESLDKRQHSQQLDTN